MSLRVSKKAESSASGGAPLVESAPTAEAAAPPAATLGGESEPAAVVPDNYRYWQEHGAGWAEEYDARKRYQPFYHIQELMLTDYVAHHAPCRVLEFGCGPGRHLKNLSRLPDVDVNGFDQSRTMVSGCLRWATPEWLEAHVRIGDPLGRLPFDDGEFDIVYTSEVLLHVRPEDVAGRIRELVRICRGHVLHIEPAETTGLVAAEHAGCWHHDYVAIYRELGLVCEPLPSGCAPHRPYRTVIGAEPRWTWSPVMLDLLRRTERDLKGHIDALTGEVHDLKQFRRNSTAQLEAAAARERELRASLAQTDGQRAALVEEMRAAQPERKRLEAALAAAEQRVRELEDRLTALESRSAEQAETLVRTREALSDERARQVEAEAALRGELRAAVARAADLHAQLERLKRRWFDALES